MTKASRRWDTSSIDGMERTAKNEESRDCSIKIRGEWLEVSVMDNGEFRYRWGKNAVERTDAVAILASK